MTYTIQAKTLEAVARLRELHVARTQITELKEYGRVLTKSTEAVRAFVEFRNGSVTSASVPANLMAAWVATLPGEVQIVLEDHAVLLHQGGSEAKFWMDHSQQQSAPIVVDAGHGLEFKLVGEAADETELADIKKVLSEVRKTAKRSKELQSARKSYQKAFSGIRGAADHVSDARRYLSTHSLADSVADAKTIRDAKRVARQWTARLRQYNPEIPADLPLSDEDKSCLTKWAAEYALADKRGWHVKRFNLAKLATNLLAECVATMIREKYPLVESDVNVNHIHEKFPNRPAAIEVYEYDHQQYSGARRTIRQWTAVREELAVTYKLALSRLHKAQGKQ